MMIIKAHLRLSSLCTYHRNIWHRNSPDQRKMKPKLSWVTSSLMLVKEKWKILLEATVWVTEMIGVIFRFNAFKELSDHNPVISKLEIRKYTPKDTRTNFLLLQNPDIRAEVADSEQANQLQSVLIDRRHRWKCLGYIISEI